MLTVEQQSMRYKKTCTLLCLKKTWCVPTKVVWRIPAKVNESLDGAANKRR